MYSIYHLRSGRRFFPATNVLKRYLNTNQTATALRPFYFAVHPDLFGKHPNERNVNEESLKQLNEYVTSIQADRSYSLQPVDLVFFIRPANTQSGLKDVKISLKSHDIRKTVSTVLQTCGLSLDYVNTVPIKDKSQSEQFSRPIEWHQSYYGSNRKPKPPPLQKTLVQWLQEHSGRVQQYNEDRLEAQTEIDRRCEDIVSMIGVQSVRWENVWGNRHYIACLRTFTTLCRQHTYRMEKTLSGRCLVFGNETGVNLHGDIVLGSDDVTTDWMNLLQQVPAYDPVIERLPRMEKELSHLLRNIQIVRRQKQEFVMAQTYEVLLNKMLNYLRRSQDHVTQQLGDQDLSHLVMVVESESGPLALTNSGQLLIPASVPGSLMISFIAENKDRAATFLIDAKIHMIYLQGLLDQCPTELQVSSITQDDAITPQQMSQCCQRLLDNAHDIKPLVTGTKLKVSTFYTVMRDGEVTIPWNWVGGQT